MVLFVCALLYYESTYSETDQSMHVSLKTTTLQLVRLLNTLHIKLHKRLTENTLTCSHMSLTP